MDDVINVAGHRLGTREIEEAVQAHPAIAEVAVVGVADQLKGQMPMAFAVVKDAAVVDTPKTCRAREGGHEIGGQPGWRIARPGRGALYRWPAQDAPDQIKGSGWRSMDRHVR